MNPKYCNTGTMEVRLIEELAELIQIISKAQRFGWNNYHPAKPPTKTNWKHAQQEMADIRRVWKELKEELEYYGPSLRKR